ncbi:MAG: hypothetical protein WC444_01990 [Candidatus Paceibacterota bacterium]
MGAIMKLKNSLVMVLVVAASSANAWYFQAPANLHFTNACLWVEEKGGVVNGFTSDGCESNYATIKGVRFYHANNQECVATTGKAVKLSVDRRGRYGRETYRVTKQVTSCFAKH